MAYVPDKAHDITISYAHVDDVPRWEGDQGWISAFEESLRNLLPRFLGRGDRLDIWRDPKLRGADFYDDAIGKAVSDSAVLISVMSTGYFASTYCLDELRTFCDTGVTVDFDSGTKSRVFKVMLNDIPLENQDERIRRTDGYKFFAKDQSAGVERIFRRTPEGAADQSYWDTIEMLAQELSQVLNKMAKRAPAAPAPPTGLSVYLAEVADDLEDFRAEIKKSLTQQGIKVLPEFRLPPQSHVMREAVAKDLEQSVLSVHLMGPLPGKAADDEDLPTTQVQYRLASGIGLRSGMESRLQRIVWLPPDLNLASVRSEAQRTFLESLRYEQESESPMELLQKSVEDLKDAILKKVLPTPRKISNKFEIKRRALVYVAHRPEDWEHAEIIMNYLLKADQDVMLMQGKDEKEQMRDLRVRMRSCNAVLILYGQPPAKWARDVTEKARDMAEKRTRNPLFAKSILDGPPDVKDNLGFYSKDWPILPCRSGIRVEALESFIKAVAVES